MFSDVPFELAQDRTRASACTVRVKSVELVSSLDSMSKSRWVTFIVVTADSTWVAMALADEHWLPRSGPSVSAVEPPNEIDTSPPSPCRAEICDCQPDWFGSDHWQPDPSAKANSKYLVP